ETLPNPGERLIGLWDEVRSLESTLSESISGATAQLAALGARSEELSTALVRLERSTGNAAGTIERGGAELGDSIRRELAQMNQVLDEYTRLFKRLRRREPAMTRRFTVMGFTEAELGFVL